MEKSELEELGRQALKRKKAQADASAARREKLKAEGKKPVTLIVPTHRIDTVKKLVEAVSKAEAGEEFALFKLNKDTNQWKPFLPLN